jgi:NADP-dependent 3-hydroxy acid dehydrogenase YdfG
VYVATKSGIQGFTEALRKEINPLGIKVTLIEPGAVGTDMQSPQYPPEEQRKREEDLKMLKAEDIAACVLYTLTQPKRCDVVSVQIRPHMQSI